MRRGQTMCENKYDIIKFRNNLIVLNLLLFNNVLIPNAIGKICYLLTLAVSLIVIFIKSVNINSYRNALIFYCLFAIASTVFSQYFALSTLLSVCQFVLWTLILAFMNRNEIKDILEKYLKVLTIVICIAIIYSFLLKTFGQLSYVNGQWVNYLFNFSIKQYAIGMARDLGYAAFYENTNIFAFLIIIVMTWNLCAYKKKINFRSICFMFLMIVGLLIADSRAAFVCALVNLFLLLFFSGGIKAKRFIYVLIIFALLCGLFVWFLGIPLDIVVNLAGREIMWDTMLNVFSDNMVLGIGFANSTKYVLDDIGSHNSYLNVLVENGLVGMTFFVIIIAYILRTIFKTQICISKSRLFLFTTIVFIMYLPYAFIENAFMIFEARHTLWILVSTFIVEESRDIMFER